MEHSLYQWNRTRASFKLKENFDNFLGKQTMEKSNHLKAIAEFQHLIALNCHMKNSSSIELSKIRL